MELENYLEGWRRREQQDAERVEDASRRAWAAGRVAGELLRERGARRIWLIGSLARGTFEPRSDVDFMVEGLEERQAWRTAVEACDRTGVEIDIIRAEALDEEWRRYHERHGRKLHG